MSSTYSGALVRSAHFASRPPVPGVNPEHQHPDPEPDPFAPAPEGVPARTGDVWQPSEDTAHTAMHVGTLDQESHWTRLAAPVPMGVPRQAAGLAATARMLADHSIVDYRPHKHAVYRHASAGRTIEYTDGRMPQVAGETGGTAAYLLNGQNAYDQTNGVTDVYSGSSANVGRYRLGTRIEDFGHYEFHTQQGQDTHLRAYSGLHPTFPVDKPRVPDSAPYTPNSSGTTTWTLPWNQRPSFFALPTETALTDYRVSEMDASGEFDDEGRL